MIDRLIILKSKQFGNAKELQSALKNDYSLRHEVDVLAKHFLGRSASGCSNCYFDAYMELINIKKMETKSKFQLMRGALLYDPVNKDVSRILTFHSCTDELALYHLKHNPNCRKYFSVLPDDVDDLIEDYEEKPKAHRPKKQGATGAQDTAKA